MEGTGENDSLRGQTCHLITQNKLPLGNWQQGPVKPSSTRYASAIIGKLKELGAGLHEKNAYKQVGV